MMSTIVAPLAAYAVVFQTALYFTLPTRLRARVAPVVTGAAGASVVVVVAATFGPGRVGLLGGDLAETVVWGLGATVAALTVGAVLMTSPSRRALLADPRIVSLDRGRAAFEILVRIPVFTALIEEAFFRGVLHAALVALYPLDVAVWVGAGLFGMWHIGPGLDQARAGAKSSQQGAIHTVATVVATTVAGFALVWLRIETGSIWAPVAVHAAVNMTMAGVARITSRRLQLAG